MIKPRSFGIAVLGHALGIAIVLQGVPPSHGTVVQNTILTSVAATQDVTIADRPLAEQTELADFEPAATPAPTQDAPPTEVTAPEPLPEPIDELPAPAQAQPEAAPAPPAPRGTFTKPAPAAPAEPAVPSPPTSPSASAQPEGFVAPAIVSPDWPRTVRRRFTGTISVEVTVSAQGKATAARMLKGTGRDDWDEALLETFLESSYSAARRGATAVECTHIFAVTFKRE